VFLIEIYSKVCTGKHLSDSFPIHSVFTIMFVKSEVFTVVIMKNSVFWDVESCESCWKPTFRRNVSPSSWLTGSAR
jgi:hypothetical protein